MIITYLLGILVGFILGTTGAGGGIIAIPVLMYGLELDMISAGPIALIAIGLSAWVGAFYAHKQKLLNNKAGIIMALAGMPLTPIGQSLARLIPYWILMALFLLVIGVVAIRMWRSSYQAEVHPSHENSTPRNTLAVNIRQLLVFVLIGAISGFMTGLLSVGGGFIIVPLLTQLTRMSIKQASATSLLVIAIISSMGVTSAWFQGVVFPMPFTFWFTLTVVIGLLFGRYLTQYLPNQLILRGFAILLLTIAGIMLSQQIWP